MNKDLLWERHLLYRGNAIVAAVTYNPKAVYDSKPLPSDLDEAFDKRYLLVRPQNVDTIATEYGDLFKQ